MGGARSRKTAPGTWSPARTGGRSGRRSTPLLYPED